MRQVVRATEGIRREFSDGETVRQPMTLVLLPGLDGTDILFRPFVQALPPWVMPRCIEYSSSDRNDYAGLLPMVRDACAGAGDFFILGWSFSGPLALMVAAQAPPGLRGVVLCASFVRAPWLPLRWLWFAVGGSVAAVFPLLSKALAVCGRYETTELRRDTSECWRRVSATTLAARSRAALRVDARAELRRCPVPLLYLAASSDIVVPRWNVSAVKAQLPSAQVVTIAGPHMALRTNPEAAADAVAKFMAAIGSA